MRDIRAILAEWIDVRAFCIPPDLSAAHHQNPFADVLGIPYLHLKAGYLAERVLINDLWIERVGDFPKVPVAKHEAPLTDRHHVHFAGTMTCFIKMGVNPHVLDVGIGVEFGEAVCVRMRSYCAERLLRRNQTACHRAAQTGCADLEKISPLEFFGSVHSLISLLCPILRVLEPLLECADEFCG